MRSTRTTLQALTLVAASALGALRTENSDGETWFAPPPSDALELQGEVHEGKPPRQLRSPNNGSRLYVSDTLHGVVTHDTNARTVSIEWRWVTGPGLVTPLTTMAKQVQTRGVSYWPTCAAALSGDRLAVGGKRRNGDTVLEFWEIPAPLQVVSQNGSEVQHELDLQTLPAPDVVLEHKQPDKDMIQAIVPSVAGRDHCHVQYYSSNALHFVAWDPATQIGVEEELFTLEVQPALDEDYDYMRWGEHSDFPHLAILRLDNFPRMYWADTDGDGRIDLVTPATALLTQQIRDGHWLTFENVPQL